MAESLSVKATLKEVHMFEISPASSTYESLKLDIRRSFPVLSQSSIGLKLFWIDEDGDKISICNDADLKHALKHVSTRNLQLHIEAFTQPSFIPPSRTAASLENDFNVRYPPDSINRRTGQISNNIPNMSELYDTPPINQRPMSGSYNRTMSYPSSGSYNSMPSYQDGQPVQETVARQTSSQSEPDPNEDTLDLPSTVHVFECWPTHDTYALNMIKKELKTQTDRNYITPRTYLTDAGMQSRVLCIINKESRGKALYQSIDSELTFLQQFCKKLKWSFQAYKNLSSQEIEEKLNEEMEKNFEYNHSLFVILLTRGDTRGIFGTEGGRIEYSNITKRFDQVETLKGKPKIFLIDDCDIGSDIYDETQNLGTEPKYTRTISGNWAPIDSRDCESVPKECLDTYVCLASTLGRSDKIVKGSWLIGALISVVCKAGNRMTFQAIMKEVQYMLNSAEIPEGKPEPQMKRENGLTKDFYLLPPPS